MLGVLDDRSRLIVSCGGGMSPGTPDGEHPGADLHRGAADLLTNLRAFVQSSPRPLVMPIGAFAGLALTGASVRDVVSDPHAQAAAALALRERLGTPFLLTAMDLSAEAEAFGSSVRLSDDEMPALTGRLVTTASEVERLAVPAPGDRRTRVHLDAAALLVGSVAAADSVGSVDRGRAGRSAG